MVNDPTITDTTTSSSTTTVSTIQQGQHDMQPNHNDLPLRRRRRGQRPQQPKQPPLRFLWKPPTVIPVQDMNNAAERSTYPDHVTHLPNKDDCDTGAISLLLSNTDSTAAAATKTRIETIQPPLLSYEDIYNYYCVSCIPLPPNDFNSTKNTSSGTDSSDRPAQQCSRPRFSLFRYIANALLVVQEFILVCYFLAWYRIIRTTTKVTTISRSRQYYLDVSMIFMYIALLLAIILNARAAAITENRLLCGTSNVRPERAPYKSSFYYHYYCKVAYRLIDASIVAGMVRYIAALLRHLTISYSTDTVERLAILALFVHVLCCDYTYANGYDPAMYRRRTKSNQSQAPQLPTSQQQDRRISDRLQVYPSWNSTTLWLLNVTSTFRGGTISLNAAFFATIVLVSRFDLTNTTTASSSGSNTGTNSTINATFLFISLAVILFAFYPVTRHTISMVYPSHKSGTNDLDFLSACRPLGILHPHNYFCCH